MKDVKPALNFVCIVSFQIFYKSQEDCIFTNIKIRYGESKGILQFVWGFFTEWILVIGIDQWLHSIPDILLPTQILFWNLSKQIFMFPSHM